MNICIINNQPDGTKGIDVTFKFELYIHICVETSVGFSH